MTARLREDLLAAVSHDMQTPLAAIVGLVDVLRDDEDMPVEARQAIYDTLARQSRALRGLVQQFLDFTRLEADRKLVLNLGAVDVVDIIESVADRFRHEREIHVGAPRDLPKVTADPARLEQVIANLVSNAVKYSSGPVIVAARTRDGNILVDVVDDGEGFEQEEIAVLFDKFQRGPNAAGTPGTGLGLYISRAIAQAHRGTLTAESFRGIGSRFRLTVPVTSHEPGEP
jgi:signal transduction histidine kinase